MLAVIIFGDKVSVILLYDFVPMGNRFSTLRGNVVSSFLKVYECPRVISNHENETVRWFEKSGIDIPLTQLHIPDERNFQLHRY